MRKYIYTFVILLFASNFLLAQLNPCGTPSYRGEWLKAYQKNPTAFEKKSGVTMYVPLTIHLVTPTGSPSGAFPTDLLFEALCTLNDDFADTEIQFYIKDEIRILDNSTYNTHQDILTGAQMMFENNVENTINCYIMDEAAGNCGYNLPYAGVALAEMCTGPDDHTWAHEIGHNLSIQHPFLGWEGGVSYDGSVSHSFSDPAPETVTYDYTLFKDTLILDTLIIDTAIVEKVDGSNCHEAADGFCDTAPDYLAFRWPCNGQPVSPAVQHDPNNAPFQSDASLIMSYAFDVCSNRFTPEQIGAMRANLIDEKPGYIEDNYVATSIEVASVDLDVPLDEEMVHFENIEIRWEEVPEADFYIFTLYNTNPVFPGQLLAGFTTVLYTNELDIEFITNDRTYVWEVEAISNGKFCENIISEQRTFHTANVSAIVEPDALHEHVILQPNLTATGNIVLVQSKKDQMESINILNSNGQILYQVRELNIYQHRLETTSLRSGVYFVQIKMADQRTVMKRLMIY